MRYAVFSEHKLVAICNSLSKAISAMPKDSTTAHILDEESAEVFFYKRNKKGQK
jgi:hypothetical protein